MARRATGERPLGGVKRVIALSTDKAASPINLYGASKLAGEAYARAYYRTYGFQTVVVRPFNTYGPRQSSRAIIPTIIGEGGLDWPAVAAGATLFLIPIVVFTVLLRKQLLRGITFGAVRK